jgi:hypothetical protein
MEPEAVGAAAFQAPHVTGTEAAAPVSVFPGMIKMEVSVIAAGVMSHPDSAIDVWSVGMALMIAEVAVLIAFVVMGGAVIGFRPARGRRMSLMSLATVSVFLHGKDWNTKRQ